MNNIIDLFTISKKTNVPIKNKISIDVEGDTNDADYIYSEEVIDINNSDDIDLLKLFIKVLSYKGEYNWENRHEYLSNDEISTLNDTELIPWMDNHDVHSITATFIYYDDNGALFDLKLK